VEVGERSFRSTVATLSRLKYIADLLALPENKCTDRLFIDRDGEYFSYILRYLRMGSWFLSDFPNGRYRLAREAYLYGLRETDLPALAEVDLPFIRNSWHINKDDRNLFRELYDLMIDCAASKRSLLVTLPQVSSFETFQSLKTETATKLQSEMRYFTIHGCSYEQYINSLRNLSNNTKLYVVVTDVNLTHYLWADLAETFIGMAGKIGLKIKHDPGFRFTDTVDCQNLFALSLPVFRLDYVPTPGNL
jgi:hypothetical protein